MLRIISVIFCAILITPIILFQVPINTYATDGVDGLADTPWPMFRGNLNHTGLSPYDTSTNLGNERWNFSTTRLFYSSPAIGPDGTIYVGSNDDNLYAINRDGTQKWNFTANGIIQSSPAVASDGTIYFGTGAWWTSLFYAVNPDGTQKWTFPTEYKVMSSPTIGNDGTIYFTSMDCYIYALNPDGYEIWRFATGNIAKSSPAIDLNGIIYVGSDDNKLYAIYPSGTLKWSFLSGDDIYSSPAIGSDGTIYVGSSDHKLYAINPNGTQKWNFTTGGEIKASPSIGPDGTIYIGSGDQKFYAINPDGTQKWSFTTGGIIYSSSAAIGSEGTLYFGSYDGKLYALNPDGSEKWSFLTGWKIYSSPAIDYDGTIYFADCVKFHALGTPSLPPISDAGSDQTVYFGEIVFFDGSNSYDPDGYITSFVWDFGDGTSTSGQKVSHSYNASGNYTVTLTVTDDDGASSHDSVTITVLDFPPQNQPPTAITGSDKVVFEGSNVRFNGSASYDPDGAIISYKWDFGDGTTGSGQTINHIYGDEGVFEVTLNVTDDDGLSDTTTVKVTVTNIPPTILDLDAYINLNFTLRIAGEKWHNVEMYIYEDGVEIGHSSITRYPGNPDDQSVIISNVKCDVTKSITAAVLYTPVDDPVNGQPNGATPCWINISYDDGSYELLHHTFNARHPETWEWNIGINQYIVGHEITFKGTGYDPGSDDLTFTWNFGDGNPNPETIYYNNGLDPDPYPSPWGAYPVTITDVKKHTYSSPGNYTVILNLKDDDGGRDVNTTIVVLSNDMPIVSAGGPYFANQGSEIAFAGIHLESTKSATPAYLWYFGDGKYSNSLNPVHIFENGGTFIASLIITDESGKTFSDTCFVYINANPIADVKYEQTAYVGDVIVFDGSKSYDPDGKIISYAWDFDDSQDRNNDGNYINDVDAIQSTVQHVFDTKGEYEITFTISDNSSTIVNTYLVTILEKEIVTESTENSGAEIETSEKIPDLDDEEVTINENHDESQEAGSHGLIKESDYLVEDEPEISHTMPTEEADKDDRPDIPISSFTASVCSLIIAMISLAMPLYMKIRVKDLLKNPKRKSIYHYITANPGDNFTMIKQSLGLTNGVLSYHLKIMEREKLIASYQDGGYKRFYLSGKKDINNAKRINGNQRVIFDIIKESPGISQTEISNRIGTTVQVVNYHIKRLVEDDLIRIEMSNGHRSQCYPKNLEIVTPI